MSDALKLVWRLQKQMPLSFWLGLFFAFIPAAAGIALLAISGWFLTSAALAGLTGLGLAFNYTIATANIRLYASLRIGGRYVERLFTHDTTFRFLERLRLDVFRGFVRDAISGKITHQATALTRVVGDVDQLDGLFLRLVVPLFTCVTVSIVTLATLWSNAPLAALTIGALQAAGLILLARSNNSSVRERTHAMAQAHDALRVSVVDLVRGRRDLAIYGGLKDQQRVVSTVAEELHSHHQFQQELDQRASTIVSLMGQAMVGLTLLFAAMSYEQGNMELKYIALFVFVAMAMPELLQGVANGVANWSKMSVAAKRVNVLLDNDEYADLEFTRVSQPHSSLSALRLTQVSFSFDEARRSVLNNVSLELLSGSKTAIIGVSGAGKSTLASLCARLNEPESGVVELFGCPLAQWSEAALRQHMVMVGQRTQILHDTIGANLRIANPQASDEQLWEALEKAGLKAVVLSRDNGLDTLLGEGGLGLSGGEGRRLSLARAYLKSPKVWIADELTEGLDSATAAQVLQAFEEMTRDATVLMISHRSMELKMVEQVFELERGQLSSVEMPLGAKALARLRED
ncbi:thiol reductant ABC exporter subunit CydC [Flexibacterium corallicola]|uniref:thiol reductant ABC exporter subunit CydC n=1 Tax=Flexibacterium corallicola TaxID=3037259 RepID=UPI00286EDE50|nr:thiol reductant ABC exporter subunit CydC [Pseudovibrio sp. M1P-2-3]